MLTSDVARCASKALLVLFAVLGQFPAECMLFAAQPPADVEQRGLLQRIRETQEAVGSQSWLQAAEKFDSAWEMASKKEDSLLVTTGTDVRQLAAGETESLAGGKARLEDLFRNAPDEFHAEFQRQFSALAEQRVGEAVQSGDLEDLRRTSVRYAFCAAGRRGIRALARMAADRGDFLEAALLLGRVHRLGGQFDAAIDLQAAYCYSRAGLTSDAVDLLARIISRDGAEPLTLNGSAVTLPEASADLEFWIMRNFGSDAGLAFQWPQPGGTYRRHGLQPRGPARLTPVWNSDLFAVEDVLFAKDLNPVLDDFRIPIEQEAARMIQLNSTIIPTASPLLVNDLAIVRMPCGLRAISLSTGELVWEVTRPDSRMKVVVDFVSSQTRKRDEAPVRGDMSRYAFGQFVDPRVELLFQLVRTNTASQMSVSGQTLFVCEESSGATWDSEFSMGLGGVSPTALPSNYIRAYDAATGIFQWEVGGQIQTNPAGGGRGNLLSGYYFLGAPLVLGRRTYVLAEGGEGLFLIQIGEPGSGDALANPSVVVSQLLTVPQYKLAAHPVRKHAGLIPSFAQGLLICPTCDERIIAVSAEDHSIRWMFRYAGNIRPQDLGGDDPVLFGGRDPSDSKRVDLDSRWIDSLPRIIDGKVLLTPRDSDQMYCLDLQSGQELWNAPRGPFHAIAAVTADRVVLVGNHTVTALKLADGSAIWTTELRDGVVCGTSATNGTVLQIPTSEPAIVTLEIASGRRLVTQALPHSDLPGNLLITEKGVLSQSLSSVTFLDFGSTEMIIADRATELLLEGQIPAAIQELEQHINTASDSSTERELLIPVLLESLRADFQKNRKAVPRLRELITISENDAPIAPLLHTLLGMNVTDAAMISSQLHGRSRRWLGELSELVARALPNSQTSTLDDVTMSIRELLTELPAAHGEAVTTGFLSRSKAVMLVAGIREAVRARPPADQTELQLRLSESALGIARSLPSGNDSRRFVRDLAAAAMPELALTVQNSLAESERGSADVLEAELLRLEIAQSTSENSGEAGVALLESWYEAKDRTAIDAWFSDVNEEPNSRSRLRFHAADHVKREVLSRFTQEHPELLQPANSLWGTESPSTSESDDRTMQAATRLPAHVPDTYIPMFAPQGVFRGWSFVRLMDPLNLTEVGAFDADGVLRWTFKPLGVVDESRYGQDREASATAIGHLLILNLSGTLFAIDTSALDEQKQPALLWQKSIERLAPDSESDIYREFIPPTDRLPQYLAQHSGYYPAGPVSSLGIPVISGRRLVMLDAMTGDRRWHTDGIARDTVLLCSEDNVLLISETSRQIEVRSLIDGAIRSTVRLPEWWGEANSNVGSSVRDIEVEAGVDLLWRIILYDQSCLLFRLSSGKSMLENRDLLTDTVTWSIELPQDSVFSNVAEDVVAVISEGKQLRLVQVDTGKLLADLAVTPIAEPRELLLRYSHGHYIVMPEAFYDPSIELDPVMNAVHVHGTICAIRRDSMTLAWEVPVKHRWIRLMDPEGATILPNAPILVLISRGGIPDPDSFVRPTHYGAVVLDVRTGKELLNSENVGTTLNHHWLRMDAESRRLELSFEKRLVTFDYSGKSTPAK